MKFLVCPTGPAPAQLKYQDTEGCFQSNSGRFFDFMVEFTENEMVTIRDNCGRSVPIDIEDIGKIGEILTRIAEYTAGMEQAREELMEDLCYGAES